MNNIDLAFVLALPAVLLATIPYAASADPPAADADRVDPNAAPADESPAEVEARTLFLQGRSLIDEGRADEACDRFRRSQNISPALGTLLNLGLCHRTAGRIERAYQYYAEAEAIAAASGDVRRRDVARREAALLAPRRASLRLQLAARPDAVLEVRIDDEPRSRESWLQPIYLEAGVHRVAVSIAPDHPWETTVDIVEGSHLVIQVPGFEPRSPIAHDAIESSGSHVAVTAAEPRADQSANVTAKPRDTGLTVGSTVAISLGAAGIIALGASFAYGLTAREKFDDSNEECSPADRCWPEGIRLRRDARSDATRATILGIAGGAAALGAIVLWAVSAPGTDPLGRGSVSIHVTDESVESRWTAAF